MALSGIQVEMKLSLTITDALDNDIEDALGRPLHDAGGNWVDVTGYVKDDPIPISRGIMSDGETDRVANTGDMKLTLNNTAYNPAEKMGYFSPDNVNLRNSFGNQTSVRINLQRASGNYYKFQGKIVNIQPEAGLLSEKRCYITVADWIDVAARTPLPFLAVMANVTDDAVIQALVDALSEPPETVDLDTGSYTYDYALTDVRSDTKVLGVLQSLALSGLSRIWMTGSAASGEVLVNRSLYTMLDTTKATLALALQDSMLDMKVSRSAYKRLRRVATRVFPMLADSSPTTIFSLAESIRIAPGTTVTFKAAYKNATGQQGPATNVITPVAGTDWNFSTVDGSGGDLNADLTVNFSQGPTYFSVSISNPASGSVGYLWQFDVRGTFLDRRSALEHIAEDTTLSERDASSLSYDMPYQTNYYTGADFGTAILSWHVDEETHVDSIVINGGQSDAMMDAVVELEPGALISVEESVTGIDRYFYVNGYKMTVRAKNDVEMVLSVIPAVFGQFATLDLAGYDELDTAACVLGF